jgi:reductive dehalogenase
MTKKRNSDFFQIEKALLIFEKKLKAQEKFRQKLGVREIDRPTYDRYIAGNIERFDRRKNSMMLLLPGNPHDEKLELHGRIKKRTGTDFYSILPYSDMDPIDRIGQSLTQAAWRIAREYHPDPFLVTPDEYKVPIDDRARMSRLIKKIAMFFGAEMVRIAKLDQRWVYKDIDIHHRYIIVVVVPHVADCLATAPSHYSSSAVAETYSRHKFIVTQLADFIRGLGYDASPRETLGTNPELLMVPIAIDAGVGEFARTGHCLSPEFGINMRMKAVTTDMPLDTDKPISFGVHDFCMVCENCAKYCPGNAIPLGAPKEEVVDIYNNTGFKKWNLNAERCLTIWNMNKKKWTSCGGRCIFVCPWSKKTNIPHNIVRWIAIHSPSTVKRFLVKGDRLLYSRTKKL